MLFLIAQPCSNSARLQKTTKNMSTTMGSIIQLRTIKMMQNGREGSYFGDGEEGWQVLSHYQILTLFQLGEQQNSG